MTNNGPQAQNAGDGAPSPAFDDEMVAGVQPELEPGQTLQTQLDEHRRKVDVEYFDLTAREIVRMAMEGELKTAPEYQRKFRWEPEDESKLIESLFLGLPVPSIFVAANTDGSWEVVDGLQRVSTLLHYIGEPEKSLPLIGKSAPLRIDGLTTLTRLNGYAFADLPTPQQLSFQKRLIRVTALSDKSDPEIRFDMFERLNTGGIELTPQEVRACVYRGDFMKLLEDLAGNENYLRLLNLTDKQNADGTKEELVLKTFAYLFNRGAFNGRVSEFLNRFMQYEAPKHDRAELRVLFESVTHALHQVLPEPIQRGQRSTTPLNLAEAVFVAGAELIRDGINQFTPQPSWLNDMTLTRASSAGSNNTAFVRRRIQRARELLEGAPPELPNH